MNSTMIKKYDTNYCPWHYGHTSTRHLPCRACVAGLPNIYKKEANLIGEFNRRRRAKKEQTTIKLSKS